MNEQDRIELGEFCENLLANEAFTRLTKLYENQTTQDLLNTKPEEKAKREVIYASFQGVRDFLALMNATVIEKNALTTKNNEEPSA